MALPITTTLLHTIISLYLLAIILRLLLRLSDADFYNPLTQVIVRITQPAVKPLQSFLPTVRGFDIGTLIAALLLSVASIALFSILDGGAPFSSGLPLMLTWACIGICNLITDIYFLLVLASIIFSWVAPFQRHPALDLIRQLAEPVMAPFRRVVPPIGGLDLSPIMLFLVINVLQIMLHGWAARTGLLRNLVLGI